MSKKDIWKTCLERLGEEFKTEVIHTWLNPLHAVQTDDTLKLLAPNRYALTHVRNNLLDRIRKVAMEIDPALRSVSIEIGSYGIQAALDGEEPGEAAPPVPESSVRPYTGGKLNPDFTFEKHVEGTSNQLARAAAMQVGSNPGQAYNPLFLYGGVGLGKTHLMQAAGNLILERNPAAKVVYVRSELFVSDMVKAIKNSNMNEFKRYYRSLDALLIDDIQFFARKTQSQEEFFHTFNTLLEGQRQIVITSDRFPKEIKGVEERLISRFGSGLTVSIEPPELETRVAILQKKALERGIELPDEVAFFVANTISSNVRELEGALHRIVASARFTGRSIDLPLAREALRDLLIYQEKRISIDSIQQIVAEYYKIRVSDLLSRKRNREIARPRQLAMTLAKEHTTLSLPQIGDKFGGRDHTTVLHACRRIEKLLQEDNKIQEDYRNLQRLLSG